jgi:hypothetical protein
MKIDLKPNERIIREGAANLQRGLETVGGWLYLTNQRLFFQSHRFNVQAGSTDIPLNIVGTVRPCWTKFLGFLPVFPNSLAVSASDKEYSFVLRGRQQWANAISAQASGLHA